MVSEGYIAALFVVAAIVLILVLVEDGLGGHDVLNEKLAGKKVLILVLVEDGLGERKVLSL